MPGHLLETLSDDARRRAQGIALVAFDVDGTLTDGCLHIAGDGHEIKVFHARDGLGLKRARANGIEVAIISARISHAVAVRMQDLGIDHVYQGQDDKAACLKQLLDALHLETPQAAFVGDDLPDLRAMRLAGLAIAVANAHPTVLEYAQWRTAHAGGHGAARDVCDMLLAVQGKAEAELAHWQ